jgi:hypothetical protein
MARPITETLVRLQGGLFIDQCSDLLALAVKAVDETGKNGKITITLDIKKVGGAVAVHSKVTDKIPEKAADPDLFYATVEGNLSVDNPSQMRLPLRDASAEAKPAPRDVDTPAKVLRNVDVSTGEIRAAG